MSRHRRTEMKHSLKLLDNFIVAFSSTLSLLSVSLTVFLSLSPSLPHPTNQPAQRQVTFLTANLTPDVVVHRSWRERSSMKIEKKNGDKHSKLCYVDTNEKVKFIHLLLLMGIRSNLILFDRELYESERLFKRKIGGEEEISHAFCTLRTLVIHKLL